MGPDAPVYSVLRTAGALLQDSSFVDNKPAESSLFGKRQCIGSAENVRTARAVTGVLERNVQLCAQGDCQKRRLLALRLDLVWDPVG